VTKPHFSDMTLVPCNCPLCTGKVGKVFLRYPMLKLLLDALQMRDQDPVVTKRMHEETCKVYLENCWYFDVEERPVMRKGGNA